MQRICIPLEHSKSKKLILNTDLIIQAEAPQRNDIAVANFYVVFHDVGIVQTFNLLFALLASTNLECVFANDEIRLA